MVLFVLVVGLLNIAIGFVTAVALTEPPPWGRWSPPRVGSGKWPEIKWRWPRLAFGRMSLPSISIRQTTPPPKKADARPAPPPRPAGFKLEELPQRWLELLGTDGVVPGSFLEASAQVMRLEVSTYREQLITAECRTRAALAAKDADALRQLCDDLKQFNRDWLAKQTEAAQILKDRKGAHGDYERAAAELEQVLHDQAISIAECGDTIATLHCRTEVDTGCKRVFERLFQLVDQAHALRDRLNDLLATILRTDGGLAGVNTSMQHDHATGLPNRIGVELIFRDWWHDDPQRQRQLSAALIDIDRFSRVNQRLGTRVGDHTIGAFSGLLNDLFRRDRGNDRLARMSGQSLLVFFGDTGPHQALSAVERARQTIEATTWDDHGSQYDLTISAGVCEVRRDDGLADVLRRLADTAKFAKLAGRNRAAIDEGDGPRLLDPPQFTVKGRVVSVGEEPA